MFSLRRNGGRAQTLRELVGSHWGRRGDYVAVAITEPVILWAELPTPDVVVVQHVGGAVTVVADPGVPRTLVNRIVALGALGVGLSVSSCFALDEA